MAVKVTVIVEISETDCTAVYEVNDSSPEGNPRYYGSVVENALGAAGQKIARRLPDRFKEMKTYV